jgi:hypothetical protein
MLTDKGVILFWPQSINISLNWERRQSFFVLIRKNQRKSFFAFATEDKSAVKKTLANRPQF